jgi:hypothetical protein
MQLNQHLERLRDRLSLVVDGERDEEARAAQRLLASLDDSVRLMLLDVLAAAAAEITRELAPGSVELRLRGSDPEFVVSTPSMAPTRTATDTLPVDAESSVGGEAVAGEGAVTRINLRLPEQLKGRVEQAAEREGLSINAWLVRAVSAVVERGRSGAAGETSSAQGRQSYTGWSR